MYILGDYLLEASCWRLLKQFYHGLYMITKKIDWLWGRSFNNIECDFQIFKASTSVVCCFFFKLYTCTCFFTKNIFNNGATIKIHVFSLSSKENTGLSYREVKICLKTLKTASSWWKGCNEYVLGYFLAVLLIETNPSVTQGPEASAAAGSLRNVQNIGLTLTYRVSIYIRTGDS